MPVTWIADDNKEFQWQCCEAPMFGMFRDPNGHIFVHEIDDITEDDFTAGWLRVKPQGWTP